MAGKADVQTHLQARRNELRSIFGSWAEEGLHAVDRAALVERYFVGTDVGRPERVGNGTSVLIKSPERDDRRANVLVLGRHATSDLAQRRVPEGDHDVLVGPGLASRFAPTVAFCEGVQAARTVTAESPVNLSYLSLGDDDNFASASTSLFTGNLDAVFVTNATTWNPLHPTLSIGCRGRVLAELTLNAGADIADFEVSGGVRNPLTKMTQLLGDLRDKRGRIALPNFYDRAIAPSAAMRAALAANGHDGNEWSARLSIAAPGGKLSSLERAALWPGASVLSVKASAADGVSAPGAVTATVAFYLIANQRHVEVERSLRDWFTATAPADLHPTVRLLHSSRPFRSEADSAPVAAQARAAYRLFGREPVLVPAGGPAGAGELAFGIGAPMAFAGIASPSPSWGTASEQLRWLEFTNGVAFAAETCLQLRRT